MEEYKTIRQISTESGESLPTVYKRLRASAIEPVIIDGVVHIKNEDINILLTKRKRGRKSNAQKTEQENDSE